MEPLAAILVPTHDHPSTLDLAVRSALEQTVTAIEVIVIGDGVKDETRRVLAGLVDEDQRVRFLDLPKGPNHGEVHRGRAIEATPAGIVCYLCDDDLLLPDHVESMLGLLAEADLANSANGYLEPDGSWVHYFSDLGSPECREWIRQPGRNVVSLTGTAHTVAAYRQLPHGWRTTPAGEPPDHYMWQQFVAEPWLRGATATRVTALQLPSHLHRRAGWDPARRRAELERWRAELASPERRRRFQESVRRAVAAQASAEHRRRHEMEEQLGICAGNLEIAKRGWERAEGNYAEAVAEAVSLAARLHGVELTRTWRLRERLRRLPLLRRARQ